MLYNNRGDEVVIVNRKTAQIVVVVFGAALVGLLFLLLTPAEESHVESSTQSSSNTMGYFLIPYLDSSGSAIVSEREEFGGMENLLLQYEVGTPFGGDSTAQAEFEELLQHPPTVAIWYDGTIIWTMEGPGPTRIFKGKLERNDVEAIIAKIDEAKRKLRTLSESQANGNTASDVVSSIALPGGNRSIAIYSELSQMERLKKYWMFEKGQYREFDAEEYSFESFCEALPPSYATYLRSYASIRRELRRAVPESGFEFDSTSELKWVVHVGQVWNH